MTDESHELVLVPLEVEVLTGEVVPEAIPAPPLWEQWKDFETATTHIRIKIRDCEMARLSDNTIKLIEAHLDRIKYLLTHPTEEP